MAARSFPYLEPSDISDQKRGEDWYLFLKMASQSDLKEMAVQTVNTLPSAVHIGADDGVGDVTDMASTAAKDAGESVKSAEPNRTVKAKRLVASYEVMEKLGG